MPIALDIAAFLDHLVAERGFSPNTIAAYKRDLDQYAKWLQQNGAVESREVSKVHVQNFVRALQNDPARYAEMVARVPMGHFGDPEHDIGVAIAWLVSDEARFITGSTIMLDGGQMFTR